MHKLQSWDLANKLESHLIWDFWMCFKMHHFDDISVAFILFFEFEAAQLQPQLYNFNLLKISLRDVATCLIVNVIILLLIKDCVNNLDKKWHIHFGFECNGDRLKNVYLHILFICCFLQSIDRKIVILSLWLSRIWMSILFDLFVTLKTKTTFWDNIGFLGTLS